MNILIVVLFIVGYWAITLEHKIGVNKTAVALLMAAASWALIAIKKCYECGVHQYIEVVLQALNQHLHDIAQLVIFLMGAMTIVALIEVHDGFKIITDFIRTSDKRKLLWVISIIAFFLSAVLDNLTTAIVMVPLVRRLIEGKEDRMIFACMIIIAANAGGVWSPLGDITTTMLWIDERVTTGKIIPLLIVPSLVSLLIPLIYFTFSIGKEAVAIPARSQDVPQAGAKRVFFFGMASLIFVPVFRAVTNLPPFMGALLGLGVMWILTDLIHKEREHLRVPYVLSKIDFSSVLFFLGILLTVAAMETAGILKGLAVWMDHYFVNKDIIVTVMGLASSIIDNVPLTAAAMGMYDLNLYPIDSKLWEMIAYSVGTGGSILIIGSAAGVVVMGMEKISFSWYFRKVSLPALTGYFLGIGSFLLIYQLSSV